MNRDALTTQRRHFDMVHGVTLRAIRALTDEDLDFRPKEGMRTPRELLYHIYTAEKLLAEAVQRGELFDRDGEAMTPEAGIGAKAASEIRTVDDMVQYAERCHDAANRALADVTDAELERNVTSQYGALTGAQFVTFIHDEHWHHRGQFYTYLRLMGKEPPSIYGYADA